MKGDSESSFVDGNLLHHHPHSDRNEDFRKHLLREYEIHRLLECCFPSPTVSIQSTPSRVNCAPSQNT